MPEAKKTILQVLPALNAGGVERGAVDLAIALKKHGYHALLASTGGSLEAELQAAGIEHIQLPSKSKHPFAIYKNTKFIQKIIQQYHVDLVHARSRAPCWSAYFACRKLKIPLVTTCHGCHGLGFLGLKKFYNRSVVKGDVVIATSEFVKQYLLTHYACGMDKIRVVFRGVGERYIRQAVDPAFQQQFKRRYQIPVDHPLVLMPGRLSRWKGQLVFIEAIAKIDSQHRPLCLMVGEVNHENYLREIKKKIRVLGLSEDVYYAGVCRDILSVYPLAAVVVSPSIKPEPFGRVPIEAGAMESVVVAANHGGAQEIVVAGETGLLVPPDDSDALAKAILQGLQMSDEQKKHMGVAARQRVLEHYTVDKMLDSVLTIYQDLFKQVQ